MSKNKVVDERVVNESNRIYKICFYIICIALFLDIIIKFNLWSFADDSTEFLVTIGIESVFLIGIFYVSTFLLARKGITVLTQTDPSFFPKKQYGIICLIGGIIVSVGLWTIRFATGSWEYGFWKAVLFCGLIYLVTFLITFVALYLTFYFAYKVAKTISEKMMQED